MTKEQFDEFVEAAKQNKDITREEIATAIKVLKAVYGSCLYCTWNDGKPHAACYSCD